MTSGYGVLVSCTMDPDPEPDLADPDAISADLSTQPVVSISFQDGVFPSASYAGTRDADIAQAAPTTRRGTAVTCRFDGDNPSGSNADQEALLRWDIAAIPAGSTVVGASITVEITDATNQTFPIYRMFRDWSETEVTWNESRAGVPWQTAGAKGSGDRGTTVRGVMAPTATGRYTVNLNADGVALVQAWLNDATQNTGLIIARTDPWDGAVFASRQATTASARPMLTVRYIAPATTTEPLPPPPPPPSTSTVYDDFNALPTWMTSIDGTVSPNQKWKVQYTGYGSVGTRASADGSGRLVFFGKSRPPNAPSQTVGNDTVGTSSFHTLSTQSFTNYRLSFDMRTVRQLRTYDLVNDPPNAWEHPWIFFNYKDRWHHVYFYLGANGFELGKKDNETQTEAQIFLRTGNTKKAIIGQWRHIDIDVVGNHFKISVDGTQIIDYVNDGSDGKKALSWNGGNIGLYAEDAESEWDNITITPL